MKFTRHIVAVPVLLWATAASTFTLPAFAQHSTTVPLTTNIETISVLGSRIPVPSIKVAGAIEVLDQAQIEASGATALTELLRGFSSINLSQSGPTGALSEVRFRGSESNHILVLVDGVEINDLGQGGLVDFAHIQVHNIARIELLKGPQSALWGSNAVAGVISISTKHGRSGTLDKEHAKLAATLSLGQAATQQLGLSYQQRVGKLDAALSASHYTTEGSNIARQGNELDGYQNTSVSAQLGYHLSSEHRLHSNIRLVDYDSDFDAVDYVTTGLPIDALNTSQGKQSSAQVRWDYQPSQGVWSQSLAYQFSRQQNHNYAEQRFTGSSQGTKHRMAWVNSFTLDSDSFVNIGLDGVQEDFEQRGPVEFGDPNQDQSNKTLSFISDGQYALTPNLLASYSARADNSDEFDNATSYRVGINYRLSSQLKMFISHGKAIKNPSFTERFGFFADTFIGNPELKPEASISQEIGLSYHFANDLKLSLSAFDTELEDEINGFVYVPDLASFSADNNDGKSTRKGAELNVQGQHQALTWSFNYAYLEARDETTTELRRARHSGSAVFQYSWLERHKAYLQASYTGTRKDIFYPPYPASAKTLDLASYLLLNANYQYQYSDNLSYTIKAENVLDKRYEDVVGFVGQARRLSLNLRYRWN